jgi:hypothetical protein
VFLAPNGLYFLDDLHRNNDVLVLERTQYCLVLTRDRRTHPIVS